MEKKRSELKRVISFQKHFVRHVHAISLLQTLRKLLRVNPCNLRLLYAPIFLSSCFVLFIFIYLGLLRLLSCRLFIQRFSTCSRVQFLCWNILYLIIALRWLRKMWAAHLTWFYLMFFFLPKRCKTKTFHFDLMKHIKSQLKMRDIIRFNEIEWSFKSLPLAYVKMSDLNGQIINE